MTIIDQARQNSAVDDLYQRVDARTPITIELVTNVSWGSTTTEGRTIITVGEAKDPAAALFHELLHADLKIAGYKQHKVSVVTNLRGLELKGILEALDNELQHHRFYKRFVAVGFHADAFYNDDDHSTFRLTRKKLRTLKNATASDYMLKFLTIIAPGGAGSDDERRKLRNFLFSKSGHDVQAKLERIEATIAAWAVSTELDPGPTLRGIIQELGGYEGAWVGTENTFPSAGWFTGEPFDEQTAEAFYRAHGLI